MIKQYDIVIPVYNGYDFFKECFESIVKTGTNLEHRIVIVDDCSTDPSILEYFDEIRDIHNVVILKNDSNLGFIKSVNKGMLYSKNNVILLNSDTVVTPKWVDKMDICAYSNPNIGTVTPLSNNATLCSVPKQWEDNELPDGFELDSFAEFIEKISLKSYVEIPSPVGFCMLIKRECIDKYGVIDEIYGKGYAEENDFGMRIYRNGYYHVVDDSTFILHKGSMTFGNDPKKEEAIRKNSKILYERYPELENMLGIFESDKPMQKIYDNLNERAKYYSHKHNSVLFINVNSLGAFPSGALHSVKEIIESLDGNMYFYNLYLHNNSLIVEEFFETKLNKRCAFELETTYNLGIIAHKEIEEYFELIIRMFNIDIVHFQTPQNLPLSLIKVAHDLERKIYFTAHDFYLICSNLFLLDENKVISKCCSTKTCENNCRRDELNFDNELNRQRYIRELIPMIDNVIAPSLSHLNEIKSWLNVDEELSKKFICIPHKLGGFNERKRSIEEKKILKVAYLGNFFEEKGSVEFTQLVSKFSNSPQVQFFIFGNIYDLKSYEVIQKQQNVHFYGEYTQKSVDLLLVSNDIDIVVHPTRCMESYGYTLNEAIRNHVLVVVPDYGALPERVINHECGWIVTPNNIVDEAADIIKQLLDDPYKLESKRSAIKINDNSKEFIENYNDLYSFKGNALYTHDLYNGLIYQWLKKSVISKTEVFHESILEESSNFYKIQLDSILKSTSWRITKPLRIVMDKLKRVKLK